MALDIPSLEVKSRVASGKGAARRLRREDFIPGVVYGINEPTPLAINPRSLGNLLSGRTSANVVFQLNVEGEANRERPVIIRELQRDPIRRTILHADFLEIRMDRRIRVEVPIVLQGEAIGKKMGGTLSQLLRELEVECLPISIPEEITLDVSGMDVNNVLHVRDITLPAGVVLLTDANEPVVLVEVIEEEKPAEEGALEGAEGEAPAEGAADAGKKPSDSEAASGSSEN
ncbi:MAG: 50S ribosomal protein L25 [bacterium]|nr:50S ribosomal protein L25 [bacterium]